MEKLCFHQERWEVQEKDGQLIKHGREFYLELELALISSQSFHQKPVIKKIWLKDGYLYLKYYLKRGRWEFKIDGMTFVWVS